MILTSVSCFIILFDKLLLTSCIEFRVQVKESEGLAVSGAADLVLSDNTISLHSPDSGNIIHSKPFKSVATITHTVCEIVLIEHVLSSVYS